MCGSVEESIKWDEGRLSSFSDREGGREDIPDRKTKCHGTGTKCHKARTDSSVGSAFEQREK